MVSLPLPPSRVSAPAPPIRVSFPSPPNSWLLPLLPMIRLSRELPVPLMLPAPVRVRFSTLAVNA
ncbi:hypothetical protein B9Z34_00535 [Limnohabitans sp. Hippo3]|nr:hypothetical protein B9Z34_00535 [Limnohabitans sp. Hippo3]